MRNNNLIIERNKSIYKDFEDMFNDGKRFDVICQSLSEKYFLVPKTIAKVVYSEAKGNKSQAVSTV